MVQAGLPPPHCYTPSSLTHSLPAPLLPIILFTYVSRVFLYVSPLHPQTQSSISDFQRESFLYCIPDSKMFTSHTSSPVTGLARLRSTLTAAPFSVTLLWKSHHPGHPLQRLPPTCRPSPRHPSCHYSTTNTPQILENSGPFLAAYLVRPPDALSPSPNNHHLAL